jgi:hypothetical protein
MISATDAHRQADQNFWSKAQADKVIQNAIDYSKKSCGFRFAKKWVDPLMFSRRRNCWYTSAENIVNNFDEKKIARFVSLAESLGYKTSVRQAQKWTLVKLSW